MRLSVSLVTAPGVAFSRNDPAQSLNRGCHVENTRCHRCRRHHRRRYLHCLGAPLRCRREPLSKPADAITACKQRPWPYINCVGTEFGNRAFV
jgi:hypothetical protein